MDADIDFVYKYLDEHSHEKDIIVRIQAQIAEREAELEQINAAIDAADKKVQQIDELDGDILNEPQIDLDPALQTNVESVRECEKAIQYQKLIQHVQE